jgi:2-dehydro-3-deoxygalactonokinase
MQKFIALDWGTTSFRAYAVSASGTVQDRRASSQGILAVEGGRFEDALEAQIGDWDTSLPVIAAGMITSRQGWVELPYVACPASAADLAKALYRHQTKSGRSIWFSTGLSFRSADGMPDVMRSEETQVFGSLDTGLSHFVAPGTHSKWISVEDERIVSFSTYVTGEVFAALKNHTILGKMMVDGPDDDAAFRRGVGLALKDPGGFLQRIFTARSLALFNEIAPASIASYLSGQVIGTEVAHAIRHNPPGAEYCILASPGLGGRYMQALEMAALKARYGSADSIVSGLTRIAKAAGLVT